MIKDFLKSHPIHKNIVPYLDLIMISRLSLFFAVWPMICIGMYIGSLVNDKVYVNATTLDPLTLLFFLGVSFICSSVFIFNQIFDADVDKNNKKPLIIDNHVSTEKAVNVSKVFFVVGLLIISFVDYMVLIPIIIMFMLCGKLYTSKKLSLKDNQWLNFTFYLIIAYFLVLSGAFYNRFDNNIFDLIYNSFVYIIPFLLLCCSVVLVIGILDSNGDELSNRLTFSLLLGERVVSILTVVLCLCSFFIGIFFNEPLASVLLISVLPFFLFLMFRGQEKDVVRSIRYPILLLNFYVMMIYPLLFYPIVIIFYVSKYYYWHRFSIHYPTLLVDND